MAGSDISSAGAGSGEPSAIQSSSTSLNGVESQGPTATSTAVNSGPISLTTQIQAITTSSTSPQASSSPSSSTTVASGGNASAASGGLTTTDQITIGVGVPSGVVAILGVWLTWRILQRKKKKSKSKDEVAVYHLEGRSVHP